MPLILYAGWRLGVHMSDVIIASYNECTVNESIHA